MLQEDGLVAFFWTGGRGPKLAAEPRPRDEDARIDGRIVEAQVDDGEELFGVGSTQARKTAEVFDAVEILDAPPAPEPPPVPGVSGLDATLLVFFDPAFGDFLGRREEAFNDPTQGVFLSTFSVSRTRASVSGDGTLAVFVDSINDICFIDTDGLSAESCLGLAGTVSSVAMSPDTNRYAFVLLDEFGGVEDSIFLELANDELYRVRADPFLDAFDRYGGLRRRRGTAGSDPGRAHLVWRRSRR